MSLFKPGNRPTLRSVIGRGHLIVALVGVAVASVSLTLLGVLALRVYADHNLHLIARSINYTVEAAVVFLDSDRFKEINDRFGHAAGDAVLVAVANRVRAQLREEDLVARLGGDEFAVLLTPLHKTEDAERIADKIIASMEEPIELPGTNEVLTSLSIGIAVYPDHGATPGTLLDVADGAMYQAKRLSRGAQHMAGSEYPVADVQIRS